MFIFLFLGCAAFAIAIGLVVHDHHAKTLSGDLQDGDNDHYGYSALIRFLLWIIGGLIALGFSVLVRIIHKHRRP